MSMLPIHFNGGVAILDSVQNRQDAILNEVEKVSAKGVFPRPLPHYTTKPKTVFIIICKKCNTLSKLKEINCIVKGNLKFCKHLFIFEVKNEQH